MYRCEVCSSVTPARQPQLKILTMREVLDHQHPKGVRTEIQKETPACRLCYDGHQRGIPLPQLAKMHRPITPLPYLSDLQGQGHQPAHPNEVRIGGYTVDGVLTDHCPPPVASSPKEEAARKLLNLLAEGENPGKAKPKGTGKKTPNKPKKPLKPLIKRGHENREANAAAKKAKSGG